MVAALSSAWGAVGQEQMTELSQCSSQAQMMLADERGVQRPLPRLTKRLAVM